MNNNGLLKLRISLKKDTFDGKDLYEKIISKLWFEPKKIYLASHTSGLVSFKVSHLNQIKKAKAKHSLTLSDGNERFSNAEPAHRFTHQSLDFEFNQKNYDLVYELVESEILSHENFIACFCCSEEDFFRQTTSIPSHYEVRGIQLPDNLKLYKDVAGWDIIDLKNNPGRIDLISYMWITSSWRMWFGNQFYMYINKEILKSFNEVSRIEILRYGVTFIELYEDAFEANVQLNRNRQRKFREYIDMEDLIKKLK